MSLSDAVLEIADQIEEDVEYVDAHEMKRVLRGYVRQLRSAVKSAEGSQSSITSPFLTPEIQHRHYIEEAKKEFKGKVKKLDSEEQEPRSVEIVDGPLVESGNVSVMHILSGGNPGDKTLIQGCVYSLGTDDKLHFCKEETDKLMRR